MSNERDVFPAFAILLTFTLGLYYSIIGLMGIKKRKMTYLNWAHAPGLKRIVHAEGEGAFLAGWVMLLVSLPCVIVPIVLAVTKILGIR